MSDQTWVNFGKILSSIKRGSGFWHKRCIFAEFQLCITFDPINELLWCSCCKYKTLLKFSCILAVIKVLKLCHENRDFWLNREKHIVALASAETKTELCSSSGPSGPRTRLFKPVSGPSGPRVTVLFDFGPFGEHCRGRLPAPWLTVTLMVGLIVILYSNSV